MLVKTLGVNDQAGRRHFVSDPELKLPLVRFLTWPGLSWPGLTWAELKWAGLTWPGAQVSFLEAVETSERDGAPCPFYLGKVRSSRLDLRPDLPRPDLTRPALT